MIPDRWHEERISLRELVKAQDQLLVCYRLQKRPSDKLLDQIARLKKELGL